MNRSIASSLVTLIVALWVNPASAAVILNPPHHLDTLLEVTAYQSVNNVTGSLMPVALPFGDSHTAIRGDETSSASYDLTDSRFTIDFTHVGNSVRFRFGGQTHQDGVTTFSSVRFSVDVDTPYTITGNYAAAGARRKYFSVSLTTASSLTPVYESIQDTQAGQSSSESFVVGGADGDSFNSLTGSATGMLTAGERYTFWLFSSLSNEVIAPPVTAAGSGSVSLFIGAVTTPIPLPPAVVLLGTALLGIALRPPVRRGG